MKLDNLAVPPFNATLMGVLKGVVDHFGIEATAPSVFGVTGHAFLINIHEQLCPSGPYCWKYDRHNELMENLGLKWTDLGFYSPKSTEEERKELDARLLAALDAGVPCSLMNMENQLITGHDDEAFFTTQPWAPHVKFPPDRLSFGTWKEFGDEYHVNFYTFEKVEPADRRQCFVESLEYAVDLHANAGNYNLKAYGIGPNAYDKWIDVVEKLGASHGNWWNATVWGECRKMAAKYLEEIGREESGVADATADLAGRYSDIGGKLAEVSDKELAADKKTALLKQLRSAEAEAICGVAELLEDLK